LKFEGWMGAQRHGRELGLFWEGGFSRKGSDFLTKGKRRRYLMPWREALVRGGYWGEARGALKTGSKRTLWVK